MNKQVITLPSDVEISASDGQTTLRGTYTNLARNQNLTKNLSLILEEGFTGESTYDDLPEITDLEQLQRLLSKLIIRFDTKPDYYTKKDYQLLIGVLTGALNYLYSNGVNDSRLEDIESSIKTLQDSVSTTTDDVSQIRADHNTDIAYVQNLIQNLDTSKQDKLIAGNNITISGNTISAEGKNYTSGEGVKIENDSISAGWTGNPLTVSVNVGNYKAGDTITSDDSIVDILTHLLTKVIDVYVVPPTASLSGSGEKSVLYGTSIQPTLTVTLTDGKFESEDKANYNYSQKLGTVLEGASIKKAGTAISTTSTISGNTIQCIGSGYKLVSPVTYTATADVSASKNSAYKNNNEKSEKFYAGNNSLAVSGSVTYTPYYHGFIGELDIKGKSDAEIRSMLTSTSLKGLTYKQQLPFAATNKSLVDTFSTKGNAIVIACPIKYDLNQVLTQGDRVPYEELFKLVTNGTKEYTVPVDFNGESVSYRVYLYKLYGSNPYTFEEISFKPHK